MTEDANTVHDIHDIGIILSFVYGAYLNHLELPNLEIITPALPVLPLRRSSISNN